MALPSLKKTLSSSRVALTSLAEVLIPCLNQNVLAHFDNSLNPSLLRRTLRSYAA